MDAPRPAGPATAARPAPVPVASLASASSAPASVASVSVVSSASAPGAVASASVVSAPGAVQVPAAVPLPAAVSVPAAVPLPSPLAVPAAAPPAAARPVRPAPARREITEPRPVITELRLSSFKSHRGAAFALAPVTLFAGASGSGKSHVLEAYEALARLGSGAALGEVFADPAGCVPERAGADAQGRRGFRIGCTVDGPAGPVSLDLAVQAEPELRIVGERLTAGGQTLLTTALRDPGRRSVQAAWFTGGAIGVTRAPLPDDRLGTALLPLRVAGSTAGQRQVLEAAEQLVVALRSVFACDPQPRRMREPVPVGTGRLRGGCDNLAEVLRRTRHECATRHAVLVEAARTGCCGPVEGLIAQTLPDGRITALLDRGAAAGTPLGRLADGELRFLALALVLLTGPGVLAVDPAAELLPARQALTVLADGLDRGLDSRQSAELLRLALICGGRGHIRLVGAVGEATAGPARGVEGVSVVDLVR